jgi:type I restriction enzyme S subunit
LSDRAKYKRGAAGDISYTMLRRWQGAAGVAPADGLVSPAYVVAKPLRGTEPRYFAHLFRTSAYMTEVDKFSRGIVKDRNRLYWEDFKRMPSCYPPHEEQVRIANAIDTKCGEIDSSRQRVLQEIALLREFRTRLISDVVTGKLDVREAAAQLPDEADDDATVDDSLNEADPDETITDSDEAMGDTEE